MVFVVPNQSTFVENMEKFEDSKPASFVINLHGTSVHQPGSIIEGTVELQLTYPRETSGIMIELCGESYVYWTGWENTIQGNDIYQKRSTRQCRSSNKIIDNLLQLSGNNHTMEQIAAGKHEFPFKFQLPSDIVLPRSYTYDRPTSGSPTGYIKYTLEASLLHSQNESYITRVDVPINEVVDINLPHLSSPCQMSKTKSGCLFCCNFGPVELSAKTDRGGYCPGDSIHISMEARNDSSRRITAVQAILKQKATFRGHYVIGNSHRYHSNRHYNNIINIKVYTCKSKVIRMIEDFDIGTNREIYNWVNKPMVIPATDPTVVPTIASCKNLEVSYSLIVSLIIRHARNLSVKIPIVIGNVPCDDFS